MAKSMAQYLQEENRMKVGIKQFHTHNISLYYNIKVRCPYLAWISLANLYYMWKYKARQHI